MSGSSASLGGRTHTLSVLVENRAGVLARITALFSRRGFNITSLAVGPTENEAVSRITMVIQLEDSPLEQITKQLNKLINVLKIVELEEDTAVERELVLVKVRTDPADPTARQRVLEVVEMFRGRIVDVAPEALVVEATGTRDKIGRASCRERVYVLV